MKGKGRREVSMQDVERVAKGRPVLATDAGIAQPRFLEMDQLAALADGGIDRRAQHRLGEVHHEAIAIEVCPGDAGEHVRRWEGGHAWRGDGIFKTPTLPSPRGGG